MEAPSSSSGGGDAVHRLQTGWAVWYDKKDDKKNSSNKLSALEFRQRLHKVGSFDSVEDFWRLYLFLKRPSQLETNLNLYLFRADQLAPMWESYPRGGCWILKVKKKATGGPSVLGKLWQDLLLGAIGEQFGEPDVVGISMCTRRSEDLLSVWNADSRSEDIKLRIAERLKEVLDLEPTTVIEYKAHADSMRDLSSFKISKSYASLTSSSS